MSDAGRTIHFLNSKKVNPRALLASVAEEENLEAVVMVVRRGGRWETCWSSGLDNGGISMAAVKLLHDATARIHEDDEPPVAA